MPAMTPTELLDDHVRRPRNLGKLLNAGAVGDIGSIVAGDALRFYLSVAPASAGAPERITAAKFQVFNALDQVGAASAVTELAVGKTLDEALDLGVDEVCAHFGGLDPVALPPRMWGLAGLRAAVLAWKREDDEADIELDTLLCRCWGIPEETVKQAIAFSKFDSVQMVVDATGAGTGCGSCKADIPRLLAATGDAKPAAGTSGAGGVMGKMKLVQRIDRAVEDQLRAGWRAAGLTVELWDFDGKIVSTRVSGGDDETRRTALAAVERIVKEIDPTLGVSAGS